MRTALVIPSRYGSTRFPGKPLAPIAGRSLVERVWRVASAVAGVDRVVVATDDDRIADHVRSFGGEAVMTPESCRNGTERAFAAIESFEDRPDAVVNLQGDAPIVPPAVIQRLVDTLAAEPDAELVTPATLMTDNALALLREAKAAGEVGGTTVTVDRTGHALYFSKTVIPFVREAGHAPVRKHVGLYGFRREALARFVALEPTPLERTEGLEQLRALEHGMRIRVVDVDFSGRSHLSVDDPADVARVEAAIAAEGELVP